MGGVGTERMQGFKPFALVGDPKAAIVEEGE
jgi:hypothetical protein